MESNNRGNDEKKIIVRQLDFNTSETTVQEYFSQFGHVSEVIMKYNESGRSKGFCFVVFNDKEVMEEVLKSEHEIDYRKVQVRRAGEVGGPNQTNKLFCGGLPHAVTEDDLRAYFSQYGSISNFEFIYDKATQERKHFCFIVFEETSSVEKIVEGKLPPGSVIHHLGTYRVECKKKFEDNHPIQKKVKNATKQKKIETEEWSFSGYETAYPVRAAPRRARAGLRGRARGASRARSAPRGIHRVAHSAYPSYSHHSAYSDPYGTAAYTDPYHAETADPYAEDPYAVDPYAAAADPYAVAADPYATAADPYATVADPYGAEDPYATVADPYAAQYGTTYGSYHEYEVVSHVVPRAGGGPMKSRGGGARGIARGSRGIRGRGSYPAPY